MADKFLHNDKPEIGYWSKRRDTFHSEINKGLASVTGSPAKDTKVNKAKKHNTSKDVKDEDKKPTPTNGDEYREKKLKNGRTMYFKGNQLVSKDEFDKNKGK